MDMEDILQFQAIISDKLDYFFNRIQECDRSKWILLAKKEKLTKDQLENGMNDIHEQDIRNIEEELNRLRDEKNFLIKR